MSLPKTSNDDSQRDLLEPDYLEAPFPHNKIKSHIQTNKDVGKISAKTVDLINTCSALFVREIVQKAGSLLSEDDECHEEENDGTTITIEHLRKVIENGPDNYQFLAPVLKDMKEPKKRGPRKKNTSKAPTKRKTRVPRSGLQGNFIEREVVEKVVENDLEKNDQSNDAILEDTDEYD